MIGPGAPDRSGLVALPAARVYVRDVGPAALPDAPRPALLLLHDFALCGHSWSEVIPDLARDFRVLAPDLPGSGSSDRPVGGFSGAYSLRWLAAQVDALLDGLAIPLVDVVGHGLGAAVGVLLSRRRLRRAVLVAPLCFAFAQPFGSRLPMPVLGPLLFRALLRKSEFKRYVERHYSTPELLSTARFDVYWDRISRDGGLEAAHAICGALADLGWLSDVYRGLAVPTSIVWGDRDAIASADDAERIASLIPDARVHIVDGCGHAPQEERPDELIRLVREHCAA